MTKEEAKRILACRGNGYSEEDFNNAIEVAFNSIPPLPSTVDEAADEFAFENCEERMGMLDLKGAFKAGAEWMTKQGETLYDYINVDGKNQRWLGENLLQGNYDAGQAVIVQIRKV